MKCADINRMALVCAGVADWRHTRSKMLNPGKRKIELMISPGWENRYMVTFDQHNEATHHEKIMDLDLETIHRLIAPIDDHWRRACAVNDVDVPDWLQEAK